MKVQVIQVPYDSAHRSLRMGGGPEHFIREGAAEVLRALGHEVSVETVEASEGFRAEIKTAFELHRTLSARVRTACEQGRFPLVLSGNCNSSLGTVAGVGTENLGVVWFDAHGDFVTPETTTSGFLDGTGLATLTGRCWKTLASSIPHFFPIAEANVIHVGVRERGGDEAVLAEQSAVAVVEAAAVRRQNLQAALEPALDALRARVGRIYLHIDMDVLDAKIAMANEYALFGGLSVEEVLEAIRLIAARFTISAGALASYDPSFDHQGKIFQAGIRFMQSMTASSNKQDTFNVDG